MKFTPRLALVCILLLALCITGFTAAVMAAVDTPPGGPGALPDKIVEDIKSSPADLVIASEDPPVLPSGGIRTTGEVGVAGWGGWEKLGNPQAAGPYVDSTYNAVGASTRSAGDWNTMWWDNTNNKM